MSNITRNLNVLSYLFIGVGKTSTAECVADSTKRPLFPITCGDIGDTASEVEANLESSFQLAHRWGCVLLLDEADIFLQKRDKTDIKRNSIVSVFLRAMEYYSVGHSHFIRGAHSNLSSLGHTVLDHQSCRTIRSRFPFSDSHQSVLPGFTKRSYHADMEDAHSSHIGNERRPFQGQIKRHTQVRQRTLHGAEESWGRKLEWKVRARR